MKRLVLIFLLVILAGCGQKVIVVAGSFVGAPDLWKGKCGDYDLDSYPNTEKPDEYLVDGAGI